MSQGHDADVIDVGGGGGSGGVAPWIPLFGGTASSTSPSTTQITIPSVTRPAGYFLYIALMRGWVVLPAGNTATVTFAGGAYSVTESTLANFGGNSYRYARALKPVNTALTGDIVCTFAGVIPSSAIMSAVLIPGSAEDYAIGQSSDDIGSTGATSFSHDFTNINLPATTGDHSIVAQMGGVGASDLAGTWGNGWTEFSLTDNSSGPIALSIDFAYKTTDLTLPISKSGFTGTYFGLGVAGIVP